MFIKSLIIVSLALLSLNTHALDANSKTISWVSVINDASNPGSVIFALNDSAGTSSNCAYNILELKGVLTESEIVKAQYSMLLSAKLAGQPVTVSYNVVSGGCVVDNVQLIY